jgi:ABC-2 type transport system permease protein
VVVLKEMADHLAGMRMRILVGLIILTAVGSIYAAAQSISDTVAEDEFLLLSLFTTAREPLPSLVAFLFFLVPLSGIALGFDTINTEHANRTLSRVLAQPIYRDALLVGKALAALATLAVVLLALWLVVIGVGLLLLGVPPSGEEILRSLAFLVGALAFAAVWLMVAQLMSVLFRQPATSALASMGLWLLFTVFWGIVSGLIADGFGGGPRVEQAVSRVSPVTLFGEMALALLHPETRTLGPVAFYQLQGAILGSPIPFGESLVLVWPHLTGLIAASLLLFAGSYVLFQRQEVRA